jgi:glucokinase
MTLAVGVDLGGTRLRAALVDTAADAPSLLAEERLEVGEARAPAQVADLLATAVDRVTRNANDPIAGVGVGIAAQLRGRTGVVANAPNFGWREVDFRELLRARLGTKVDLYNDLKAITWGEARYGAGQGSQHMLCIYLGTGIGSGICAGGRLVYGVGNLAGEIGHTKVVWGPDARPCGCGQRGCIEAYAGGKNLQMRVQSELGAGAKSAALELAGGDVAAVHPGHVDEAARAGDSYARTLWAEIAPLLGITLANACTMLNPDRMVMGGGTWSGTPELRRLTLEVFWDRINAAHKEWVTVVETSLGAIAGMLGAASLITAAAAGAAQEPASRS